MFGNRASHYFYKISGFISLKKLAPFGYVGTFYCTEISAYFENFNSSANESKTLSLSNQSTWVKARGPEDRNRFIQRVVQQATKVRLHNFPDKYDTEQSRS